MQADISIDLSAMPDDTRIRLARETSLFIRRLIHDGTLRQHENESESRYEICKAG